MAIKEKLKTQSKHIEELDKHMSVLPTSKPSKPSTEKLTIHYSDDVIKAGESSGQGEQK